MNALAPDGVEYKFIDNPFIGDDSNGGEPGGNIRTAYLYREDRVDFVEGSLATIGADGAPINTPAGALDQQTNPGESVLRVPSAAGRDLRVQRP